MKKIILQSSSAAILVLQSLGLAQTAQAYSAEPRPNPYTGVVDCITRPDGVKQCQPGNYVTPGQRPPSSGYYPPPVGHIDPLPPHHGGGHHDDNPYAPYPPSEPYYPPVTPDYPAPPADGYYPPPPADGGYAYGFEQFYRDEQEAKNWYQRYYQAPSGSWDESFAKENFNRASQQALQSLDSALTYQNRDWRQAENLGLDLYQKYVQAASGSALERFYSQASTKAFDGTAQIFQNVAYQLSRNELYQLAQDYSQRYNQAPSGSRSERFFSRMRDIARNALR
ncbi:MAG: hypothetical protein ACOYOK_04725 [Pseudobdellovibrionaceae bacterium]